MAFNVDIADLMDHIEEHMMKTEESLQKGFAAIRTGKASPSLVENIMVDYYGSATRLKEIAGITAPETRLLVIQPWDRSALAAIEKAILASDVGITPADDGTVIRLIFPQLTEEHRKTLAKQIVKMAEDARVAVRNIRRDANDEIKKLKKDGEMTEDEQKASEKSVQDLTDKYIKDIDGVTSKKEKEIMQI